MRIGLGAALALVIASSALAQPKIDPKAPPAVTVVPLPPGAHVRPVALTRVGSQVRDTQNVGTMWVGVICIQPTPVTWQDVSPGFVDLKDVFGEELKTAGFQPDQDPGNLFADTETSATDLEVGAMLRGINVSYCGDLLHMSGKMTVDVEWQVYSNLRREVVAKISTHEVAQRSKAIGGKETKRSLGQMAFAASVRALLNDEQFRQLVTAPDPNVPTRQATSGIQAPISLVGARKGRMAIADASGSVVSVFAGSAFGSGVLVSSDGYLLTNQHVVGTAKTVRVRWSDGFESTGEVLRTDKRRDVALIRTTPHGCSPLAVNRTVPASGTTVFAIGTPLDPKLNNTVTRGIVSANRLVDGFSFIQSDVAVTHGNSGGPLLDENGAVIGLTVLGLYPDQSKSLNLFIPIGDALDFLALKPAA
jgi:S1-C subfamily serine protease